MGATGRRLLSGFIPGYTPPAVTLQPYAVGTAGNNVYMFNDAPVITDGFLDLRCDIAAADITSGNIAAHWKATAGGPAVNFAWLLQLNAGKMALAVNGVFNGDPEYPISTATIASAGAENNKRLAVRAVINASSSAKSGFAAGTCTFYTATVANDGTLGAWAQLGSVVTGVTQAGLQSGNGNPMVFGTLGAGNLFTGRLYRMWVYNSAGTLLTNPDLTSRPVGETADWTDAAGKSWSHNGPHVADTYATRTATSYPRLTRTGSLRMKGLVLTPKDPANASWGLAWAQYSSADFDARMLKAKQLGMNTVKIFTAGTPNSNFPNDTVLEANIADFCALARKHGLYITIDLATSDNLRNGSTTQAAAVARLIGHLNMWMKHGYDRLIYVCVVGEYEFRYYTGDLGPSSTISDNQASDIAALMAACRVAAPDMPLGLSVYMGGAGDYASSNNLLQYQKMFTSEFNDLDCYDGKNGANNIGTSGQGIPQTANFAAVEASTAFVGAHIASEWGMLNTNANASKTAGVNGIRDVAAMTLSRGACYFGDVNFTSSGEPGLYGAVGDATLEAALTAWPTPA